MTRKRTTRTSVSRRSRMERAMIRHTITRILQERSGRSAGRVIRLVHLTAMATQPHRKFDELDAVHLLRP
jgi:hypothetical protein